MIQAPLTAQNYAWAKSMGTTTADVSQAIAVDASGNVYTTGYFQGTVDFDPSAGTANLTSAGANDIFVCKLDSSGNLVWAKNMGSTTSDFSYGIAVDASGNVYTTGYFSGKADFNPASGVADTAYLTPVGSNDAFVCKLDASGNFVWAKSWGNTYNDASFAIAVDAAGNVYTTGTFGGTVDFDPNAGTSNLTSSGNLDIFVSKLDVSGNFVWAKNLGGTNNEQGNAIAIDASGNVYTTGVFFSTVDFDPGAGTANLTSAGSQDVYVSKLNASGNFVWAKSWGSTGSESGNAIKIDASGNVYITGNFASTVDFDPDAGTTNLISAGSNDIYVSKLDASGSFVWAKSWGSTGNDVGKGITIDTSGNVYTTGYFASTVDFDPDAGTTNLISAGSNDIYVSKLDASGSFVWAKKFGGTGADVGYAITVDSSDNVYTSGSFSSTADFDPNICSTNLTSAGNTDIYVNKLRTYVGTIVNNWLGVSTDWSTAANWSCGVPTSTDSVVIQTTANNPTLASDQVIDDLTLLGTNKIQLGNFNLTVNNLSGGSSSTYIVTNGTGSFTIKNIGTSAKLFPIGPSTTDYSPVTITNNVNRDFSVRVGTTVTSPVSGYKYVNLEWDITPSVSSGNTATLALGWSTANQAVGFDPASAVTINHYNTSSSTWDVSLSAAVSGSGPYTATASGISNFSPFSVSNQAPLPIELLDFSGKNFEKENWLTWSTASEINNKEFQIERSIDNSKWSILGYVSANNTASNYEFVDQQPLSMSYYRLRQIDNNGTETLSKVIVINATGNSKLKVYPTITSSFLTIETAEVDDYQIFNLLGQQVLNGKTKGLLDVSTLQQGTYIVHVGNEQTKFMKQ